MKTCTFISGTHCASCKALIEDVCRDIANVKSCTVNFETGATEIEHDASLDWDTLKKEIASLGEYQVDDAQTVFACSQCGMRYRERTIASQCEAWCTEHTSCNLEIIKNAINSSL